MGCLLIVISGLVLVGASPVLVKDLHAATGLALAVGLVLVLSRLVWYFTHRW